MSEFTVFIKQWAKSAHSTDILLFNDAPGEGFFEGQWSDAPDAANSQM